MYVYAHIWCYKLICTCIYTKKKLTSFCFAVLKKPEKKTAENFNVELTDWLFTGCWEGHTEKPSSKDTCTQYRSAKEYPGYDGWYNNVGKPELGAVDTPLLRKLPAAYEDGVYEPSGSNRPKPLELSDKLLKGNIGSKSKTGRNALLVFFGA